MKVMKDTLIHITEPKYVFRFCPKCGESTLVPYEDKALMCKSCGMIYYINVASAVCAFIFNDQKELMLVKRGVEPSKGMLDLPGGFVDYRENAEEAIKREIKEELCLVVEKTRYIASFPNRYIYEGFTYFTLDIGFECTVSNLNKIVPDDDVSGYRFVNITEIVPDQLAFPSTRSFIEYYKKHC